MRKPSIKTIAINVTGAAIAFNREIGAVWGDFVSGKFVSNPQGALQDLALAAVGLQSDNTVSPTQLTASLTSKAGGYVFVKVAKWFTKRMRF
jgi:hypothetical protein